MPKPVNLKMLELNPDKTDQKIRHLALTYLAEWDQDHNQFIHIELLQKVLKDIKDKGEELSDAFKDAAKSVVHLETKDALDEDEMNEYSSATGWIDSAIEEYQAHREVIAESILIALSRMIETRATAGADLIIRYSPKYNTPKLARVELDQAKKKVIWHLCRFGPKIKNAFWAEAVRVGGNYVRHRDEWRVFPYKEIIIDGKKYLQRKPGGLVAMLETSQMRSNAGVIVALGIPDKDFLEHKRELGFKLVDLLNLDEVTKFAPHFTTWMDAMTEYVKNEISHASA